MVIQLMSLYSVMHLGYSVDVLTSQVLFGCAINVALIWNCRICSWQCPYWSAVWSYSWFSYILKFLGDMVNSCSGMMFWQLMYLSFEMHFGHALVSHKQFDCTVYHTAPVRQDMLTSCKHLLLHYYPVYWIIRVCVCVCVCIPVTSATCRYELTKPVFGLQFP